MQSYTIHITKHCNMFCNYCYEMDKTSQYSWYEIKNTLDKILNNCNKKTCIEFIGGEPLLRFDLIKKSIEYFNNKNIKVGKYIITTNGTILNDNIIEFLIQNDNIEFYISIDGNKNMNQLRVFKDTYKNSYDIIIKNYKELKKYIHYSRISAHMVVHLYNVGYLYEGINHLYNLGFKKIDIGIVEKTMEIDDDFCNEIINQFKKISYDIKNGYFGNLSISLLDYEPIFTKKTYSFNKDKLMLEEVIPDVKNKSIICNLKKQIYDNHHCVKKNKKELF